MAGFIGIWDSRKDAKAQRKYLDRISGLSRFTGLVERRGHEKTRK
jgi:hypothetical protein